MSPADGIRLIFLVAVCLLLQPAHAQESVLGQADALLEAGQLEAARRLYEEAEHYDKRAALLGQVRVALEARDWKAARRRVEEALRHAPADLEARYLSAVAYRESARRSRREEERHRSREDMNRVIARDSSYRDVLYQKALLEREEGNYVEAIRLAERQLELKPLLAAAQVGLLRIYDRYLEETDYEEALRWLQDRSSDYARYALGEVLRRRGQDEQADATLMTLTRRLLEEASMMPVQPVLLARARIYYEKAQDELAQSFVEQAIDHIDSEAAAAIVFEDAKYVLHPEEQARYEALKSAQEHRAFFRRMWTRRDPMPAAMVNERMAEHYRRLLKAEQDFRYHGTRSWHNTGDPLGRLDLPPAYAVNDKFNDKGLIYIRHGAPHDRIRTGGRHDTFRTYTGHGSRTPSMPKRRSYQAAWLPNESWRYRNPDMDFHFVVPEGERPGNWRLAPALTNLSMLEDREEWGGVYAHMADAARKAQRVSNNMVYEQEFVSERERLLQQSHEAAKKALTTDTHTFALETTPLRMQHVLAAFRGEGGTTRLDLYYGLSLSTLRKGLGGARDSIALETGFALQDTLGDLTGRHLDRMTLPLVESRRASSVGNHRLAVAPGIYEAAFHGRTLNAPLLGSYRWGIQVPDFMGGELMLSDVVLAFDAEPPFASPEGRASISPNPFRRFRTDQPVHLYFEIYNLRYGAGDKTKYTVRYTLHPAEEKRGFFRRLFGGGGADRPVITLESTVEGTEAAPSEYAEIDVQDVEAGTYELVVEVTDEHTGEHVERLRMLTLIGSE